MRRLNLSSARSVSVTSSVDANEKEKEKEHMDMDFAKRQPRSVFVPPHKTQLPPRGGKSASAAAPARTGAVAAAGALLVASAVLYVARGLILVPFVVSSGIVIDAGSTGSRIHVFEYEAGADGIPRVRFGGGSVSVKARPGLSAFASRPEQAGKSLLELLAFARAKVPIQRREKTRIFLMATAGLRRLDPLTRDAILDSCRKVLRFSGFLFRDDWASIITGPDEGVFAWIAANYALGTLGGHPQKTTGIIELGGASAQVTFVPEISPPPEFLQTVKLGGVTYKLYSNSFLHFGLEAAMEKLRQAIIVGEIKSSLASENTKVVLDPCTPRGHTISMKELQESHVASIDDNVGRSSSIISAGNFSECKNIALSLLQRGQADDCLYQQCKIGSTYIPELRGKFFATENFFYTFQFFRLAPKAHLSDLARAGQRYCGDDWAHILERHSDIEKDDLLKYCFSSAYIVALLNESLGISMNDERVRFTNEVGDVPLDWALGAFILCTVGDLTAPTHFWIFEDDSLSFLSLLAVLLLVGIAGWSFLRWRKPHSKTIYDLEKGRYIITSRVQR